MKKPNKFIRSLLMFFPLIWLGFWGALSLFATGGRDLIYIAFNWPNYWTVSDEWFDMTMEFDKWSRYWRTGRR